jgi:hypothetical protein|tara:strand:+ start:246 stop:371 length:126 start_codon:yes stop_codon:yes gene_type:complete
LHPITALEEATAEEATATAEEATAKVVEAQEGAAAREAKVA